MQAGLSTKNAPSPSVVLPHYAAGAIFFLTASILMFFAAGDITTSYIGPKVLSVTHILVLGWVTVIIFGALYQLIPVVMEIKLFSEILAHISFYTLVTGTLLLSYSFWNNYIGETIYMQVGGTLIFISVLLFTTNTLFSALKTKQKTYENLFIVSSAFWLLLTVGLGIFITMNLAFNFIPKSNLDILPMHFHLGITGWFIMLIIGVASTLLPMFFISHNLNKKYLKLSFYLINIGLTALTVSLFFDTNIIVMIFFGLIILAGILSFVKYNYDAYKKRLRKKLDIGMKLTVLSFIPLFSALIFGILAALNLNILSDYYVKIKTIYGISLILGFFTSLILGQMYKTLPFIVWLKLYQDKVGKYKIPMPASLYSEKIADLHYYSFIVAFITLFVGIISGIKIITQISAIFFVATSTLYLINTLKIIFHKEKTEPLK